MDASTYRPPSMRGGDDPWLAATIRVARQTAARRAAAEGSTRRGGPLVPSPASPEGCEGCDDATLATHDRASRCRDRDPTGRGDPCGGRRVVPRALALLVRPLPRPGTDGDRPAPRVQR